MAVFDATFYGTVLPDLVKKECQGRPEAVPVVELRLGDGTVLDVCHILNVSDRWLAVSFFRDPQTCEDMDITFLPYELVVRVVVSLHSTSRRTLGFQPQPVFPLATTPASA